MKVFFESSIFLHQTRGGISKYITEINNEFLKLKIHSLIYSPLTINVNIRKANFNNIFFLRFNKIPKYFTRIFYLINNLLSIFYIHIFKPDIIHFTYYNNFFLRFIKTPYVLTIYDLISEKNKSVEKRFNKNNLIKNASKIICISNQTKKDLIKFYKVDSKKIYVVYLGVKKSKPLIKNKNKFILFVGSRKKYKNFINLAKAYSQSNYLKKNYKILCFGEENFELNEIKFFKKLGIINNIIFKQGNDFTLEGVYRKASLYICPSIYEGFGLTPLEAMRCGCPTVCSNIPVFKETLSDSCEYIDPKNSKNIRFKIESILKSKKKQNLLIKKGYLKVKHFSWKKCAKQTLSIYKKVKNDT